MNYSKSSIVFSKGVPQASRDDILNVLDMKEVLSHEKYLGLPTHIGKSKLKAFAPIKHHVGKKKSKGALVNLSRGLERKFL